MNEPKRITRRDFIKNTMVTGGSLLLATCIPANGTAIPSVPLSSPGGLSDCSKYIKK